MRQSKSCWHSYQAIFDHDRCSTQRTQGQLRERGGCAPSRSMVADQHAALHDSSLIWRRAARRFHGLAAARPGARFCPEPVQAGRTAAPSWYVPPSRHTPTSCQASLPTWPGQATGSTALLTFAPITSMDLRHGSARRASLACMDQPMSPRSFPSFVASRTTAPSLSIPACGNDCATSAHTPTFVPVHAMLTVRM